ncbi:MAG: ABC transporter ATP-binding protein [Nitrospirales bacterium]
MKNAITIEKLSKQYRLGQNHETMFREMLANFLHDPFRKNRSNRETIWALKDLSFSISKGEVVGIIGRNGAGKSTLLKLLSKITHPTSGEITLQGRVSALLEVGTGFHEELTGRENIYLNGSILGLKKYEINEKLDAIINFSGVETFIDTPIKRYSSGMRMRLGFSVAAHLAPDILLVDEVLAVGDIAFQKKCLQAMDDLRGGGRTVLFVSHNMAAIENLCPRTLWIDNGQLRQDGDTRDVVRSYMSSFAEKQANIFDLTKHKTRSGNGSIRFTSLQFLNLEKQPQDLFRSGDSLIVRFNFEVNKKTRTPYFGIKIFSDLGTLLTELNTWNSSFEILQLNPEVGTLELQIKNLNLMPGQYPISIWISDGSTLIDVIDHCATLDMEASDFYQTGRGIERLYGVTFFPCSWELVPQNP